METTLNLQLRNGRDHASAALMDYFSDQGRVPGIRIQTQRNSLHMPLDQFLEIAAHALLSQGWSVVRPLPHQEAQ